MLGVSDQKCFTCNPKRDEEGQISAHLNSDHDDCLIHHVPPPPLELRLCANAHVPVRKGVGPVDGFQQVLHLGRPSGLLELPAELCLQEEVDQGLGDDEDQEEGEGGAKTDLGVECVRGRERIFRICSAVVGSVDCVNGKTFAHFETAEGLAPVEDLEF